MTKLGHLPFYTQFFPQNDSEWPKMDFEHNFEKRFDPPLNGKKFHGFFLRIFFVIKFLLFR